MSSKRIRSIIGQFIVGWLAIILLSGCSVIDSMLSASSAPPGAQETAIAKQVEAQVALALGQQPAQPAQPSQPVQPEQPTQAPLPTYTLLPTYTPFPTYTPLPTYTAVPTFTPLATNTLAPTFTQSAYSQGAATPNPEQRGCCTLRVRNTFRRTYWIGTKMPYGGNFIKPLWYVEFYPHQPTWMRIWYCRYTSYFREHWNDYDRWYYNEDWNDQWNWNYWKYWQASNHLYNCNYRDVYVDQTLVEISVP